MTGPPRVSQVDPLHEAKQVVLRYGDDIKPATVKALLQAVRGMERNSKGYAGKCGPIVAKHYRRGHEDAMELAVGILYGSLLGEGQVFAHLLEHLSPSGARYRVMSILRSLEEATEAGIWHS